MMPPIATTFRELMRYAKAAGAPDAWCKSTSDALVGMLLELEVLRRVADPRKVETMNQARKVAEVNTTLLAAGVTDRVPTLARRFGLSRSRINELIAIAGGSPAESVLDSEP